MAAKTWYYLSFARADRFLGACVVEARSAIEGAAYCRGAWLQPRRPGSGYPVA